MPEDQELDLRRQAADRLDDVAGQMEGAVNRPDLNVFREGGADRIRQYAQGIRNGSQPFSEDTVYLLEQIAQAGGSLPPDRVPSNFVEDIQPLIEAGVITEQRGGIDGDVTSWNLSPTTEPAKPQGTADPAQQFLEADAATRGTQDKASQEPSAAEVADKYRQSAGNLRQAGEKWAATDPELKASFDQSAAAADQAADAVAQIGSGPVPQELVSGADTAVSDSAGSLTMATQAADMRAEAQTLRDSAAADPQAAAGDLAAAESLERGSDIRAVPPFEALYTGAAATAASIEPAPAAGPDGEGSDPSQIDAPAPAATTGEGHYPGGWQRHNQDPEPATPGSPQEGEEIPVAPDPFDDPRVTRNGDGSYSIATRTGAFRVEQNDTFGVTMYQGPNLDIVQLPDGLAINLADATEAVAFVLRGDDIDATVMGVANNLNDAAYGLSLAAQHWTEADPDLAADLQQRSAAFAAQADRLADVPDNTIGVSEELAAAAIAASQQASNVWADAREAADMRQAAESLDDAAKDAWRPDDSRNDLVEGAADWRSQAAEKAVVPDDFPAPPVQLVDAVMDTVDVIENTYRAEPDYDAGAEALHAELAELAAQAHQHQLRVVEAGIREAYRTIDETTRSHPVNPANWSPGNPVRLAELRAALPAEWSRELVDEALKLLDQHPGVTLYPSGSKGDEENAIYQGGEHRNTILIRDRDATTAGYVERLAMNNRDTATSLVASLDEHTCLEVAARLGIEHDAIDIEHLRQVMIDLAVANEKRYWEESRLEASDQELMHKVITNPELAASLSDEDRAVVSDAAHRQLLGRWDVGRDRARAWLEAEELRVKAADGTLDADSQPGADKAPTATDMLRGAAEQLRSEAAAAHILEGDAAKADQLRAHAAELDAQVQLREDAAKAAGDAAKPDVLDKAVAELHDAVVQASARTGMDTKDILGAMVTGLAGLNEELAEKALQEAAEVADKLGGEGEGEKFLAEMGRPLAEADQDRDVEVDAASTWAGQADVAEVARVDDADASSQGSAWEQASGVQQQQQDADVDTDVDAYRRQQ